MNKSSKNKKRDFALYIVMSIALLPFVLIALAMIFYLLNSFVKTTSAKTTFARDVVKIAPAVEEYQKLYGYYPSSLKSLDEGLASKYSPVCDGSTDQPMGCTSDKYTYSISSNYTKNPDGSSTPTDCGYMIVISQDAIKGLRIIEAHANLKNSDNIDCKDFVERASSY